MKNKTLSSIESQNNQDKLKQKNLKLALVTMNKSGIYYLLNLRLDKKMKSILNSISPQFNSER